MIRFLLEKSKKFIPKSAVKLGQNTAVVGVAQFARVGANTILSLVIARYLGASGLGKYTILTAYLVIGQQIASAGVPRYLIREIAKQPQHASALFSTAFFNQLITGILGMIGFFLLPYVVPYDAALFQAMQIAALSFVPFTLSAIAEAIYQGEQLMHFMALSQLVGRLAQVVGSILFLLLGYGFVAIAWMIVLGQCLSLLVNFIVLIKRRIWHQPRFELLQVLRLFPQSFDFFLLSLTTIAFNKLDALTLSWFADETSVGIYSAAWLVIQLINTITASYGFALYPMLSESYQDNKPKFRRIFQISLRATIIIGLMISIALIGLGNFIIDLVFSLEDYVMSPLVLRYLAPFVTIAMFNALLSNSLLASDKQRYSLYVSSAKIGLGLPIYIGFTFYAGIVGTAVATVCIGLIGVCFNTYFLNSQFKKEKLHDT